ncbi:Sterol 3-beta-glucosyltransferase [Modicella reniformis]|uniref:sterol 3beta-glucosyltransferase n=1 Tax=Modicella reniformis TaxID=1440133 RepID=A0A9P6LRW6_9FUNG|nr:Sterol 3-beta-glucosyltransferase [Modicella reniformis]
MALAPKTTNPPTSGSALLQFFTAAFRSHDLDTNSDEDDESNKTCSTNKAQGHDLAIQTDNLRDGYDNKDRISSNDQPARHDLSHINTNNNARGAASGGFSLGSVHDKGAVAQKLQEAFGYSKDEELVGEYSCWMARSVLLPGYMYLTTNHICFYANLPSSHDVVQKEGYFSIKSKPTKTFSRYWFVLKNDVLSCYEDQSEIYYPIKTIDLKDAMSAEPSLTNELTFNVYKRSRKYKFKTDSEMARTEWVKAVQKSIFHARMSEDSVKISIPLANVLAVEMNSTSFADTIRLAIKDANDMEDEFYFAYFEDTSKALAALKSHIDEYQKTGGDTSKDLTSLRFINSTSPTPEAPRKSLAIEQPQGPLAVSLSGKTSQSTSTYSWFNPLKYLHPSDALSASSTGSGLSSLAASSGIERATRAAEISTSPSTTSTTRVITSGTGQRASDTHSGSISDIEITSDGIQETYRKEFSLPEGESLAETYSGYLLRVLPVYGKIYLSDNYICFKSTMYGSSTKVVLPLADVEQVDRHHGTQFYFHGLAITTKTEDEIFFEFSNSENRSTVLKALRDRTTPEAQERRKEYRAQAVRETKSLELDDPMESRVMDSLQLREESVQGEPMSLASHPGFKPSRPLHITCLTIGSRGDVQPYIALCKRLMEDGHTCRIATHGEYKDWVEGHGIEFGYVGGDPGDLIELCVENGMFTVSFIREGMKRFRGWLDDLFNTAWNACQNTDVLIESPSAMAGIHIAEALEIPYFRAFPFPWTRTRAFPHPFAVPERNLGRGYNYMTYSMIEQVFWKGTSKQVNRWRRKRLDLLPTSLEKMETSRVPCLYSWSPSLVSAPMDWHSWVHVTGYWFLDNPDPDWTPPEGLEQFLQAEPDNKPVYIGFGSMVVSDPEGMTKTITDAVVKAGVRAIISKGWSDKLSTQDDGAVEVVQDYRGEEKKVYPSSVYMLKSAPHDWLFPRVAGVVHHGGAGTTAAGLRAGIPTVIKPYFGDQYFWAQRVEDAGIGVWCHDLTVKKLAAALETITTDQNVIKKAQVIGEKIRAEDGVGMAIQYFYHDFAIAKQQLEKRKKEKDSKEHATTIVSRVRAVAASAVATATGGDGEESLRRLSGLSAETTIATKKSIKGEDINKGVDRVKDKENDIENGGKKDKRQDDHFSVSSVSVSKSPSAPGLQRHSHSMPENDPQSEVLFKSKPLTDDTLSPATEPGPDRVMEKLNGSDKTAESLAADLEAMQPRRPQNPQFTLQGFHGKEGKEYVNSPLGASDHKSGSDNASDSCDSDDGDGQEGPIDGKQGKKKSKARRALGSLASKAKKIKDHIRSPGNVDEGVANEE